MKRRSIRISMGGALALVLMMLSACTDNPFSKGSKWKGQYECRQGVTELELSVIESNELASKAIFSFRHPPTDVKGSFYLAGTYDPKTQEIKFEPGEWIDRPSNYVTVGMQGTIRENPTRYEGKITVMGCHQFSVVRQ